MSYCAECGAKLKPNTIVCLNCGCQVSTSTGSLICSSKKCHLLGISASTNGVLQLYEYKLTFEPKLSFWNVSKAMNPVNMMQMPSETIEISLKNIASVDSCFAASLTCGGLKISTKDGQQYKFQLNNRDEMKSKIEQQIELLA